MVCRLQRSISHAQPLPRVVLEQHVIGHHHRSPSSWLKHADDILKEAKLLIGGGGVTEDSERVGRPPPFLVPNGGLVRTRPALDRRSLSGDTVSASSMPPPIPSNSRYINHS